MNFEVPQFIEVEDKIAFQLTAKQLGWFGLAGVAMFIIWTFFSKGVFIVLSVIIAALALALSFYRPHGVSLVSFIGYSIMYFVKPKTIIWKRDAETKKSEYSEIKIEKKQPKPKKNLTSVDNISDLLDNEIKR